MTRKELNVILNDYAKELLQHQWKPLSKVNLSKIPVDRVLLMLEDHSTCKYTDIGKTNKTVIAVMVIPTLSDDFKID